jgi:hypothetical protein
MKSVLISLTFLIPHCHLIACRLGQSLVGKNLHNKERKRYVSTDFIDFVIGWGVRSRKGSDVDG